MSTIWYCADAANRTALQCQRAIDEVMRVGGRMVVSGDARYDPFALGYALAVLKEEQHGARRYVAKCCAPWFDNSAFAPEAWFVLQWEGEPPAHRTPLAELLEANRDAEDLCEWLKRARPGETFRAGGGAAPLCEVRRVA